MSKLTNKQILRQAIEKALHNGWRGEGYKEEVSTIFSHSFAKAFFPDDNDYMIINEDGGACAGKYYIHHLQRMVSDKEPLKYLEKFL